MQATSQAETLVQSMPLAVEGEEGKLYPVSMDTLYPDSRAPCDLFRRLRGGEMVFYAQVGIPFDESTKQSMLAHGVEQLYIREEDTGRFFNYIKEALTKIIASPSTPARKKAEAVHIACRETMRRAYEEPRGTFLQQAHEVVTPTVDLLINDDQATRCLVRLTAYDHCTYVHSTNVGIFGVALARILFGRSAEHDMHRLGAGFFLHDLGKCKIPIDILNKPGALSTEERSVINLHPENGYQMLKEAGFMTDEAEILTLQHHEREDGKGSPAGLTTADIHPYARICRLVDVYEALTAERPYHARRSTFEALKFMQEKIMTDLDQELLRSFVQLFAKS